MSTNAALPGIGAVGHALKRSVAEIMAAYVERLAADPVLPEARGRDPLDLEDHTASLLIDVAQSLIATAEADVDVTDLLKDGTEIQRLVSRLHGAQRARTGWSEDGLRREFRILIEEVEAGVRRDAGTEAQLASGIDLVRRALEQAFEVSLRELRAGR